MTKHYRACNLCEAICGLEITVDNGKIQSIIGDKQDPFSQGHFCVKAKALQDIQEDPNRLKRPIKRTPSGWQEVPWPEALDEAAERIRSIQDTYGRNAMGFYAGNPTVHSLGAMTYGPRLIRTLKTKNRFSATSVDQLPHMLAAFWMFGHQLLIPVPDIDRTDFLLILGANPAVSNGSMMTAPNIKARIKAIRKRGGRVVLIDPRKSETSTLVDRHYFIRPGTDAMLLACLIHLVFQEKRVNLKHMAESVQGLEAMEKALEPFDPGHVAASTGMTENEIRILAHEFLSYKQSVCYGRMGLSTQSFGTLCQWLILVLNLVTGNLDRPGGAMFTKPAVDTLKHVSNGHFGRWKSQVRGLPEFSGELPVATLAEEILVPNPNRIRGLVTSAGNPVLSTPNGVQIDQALSELDFMVSIDFYLNETTRHAHLILPPTPPLEREHYDLVFNLLAIRNTTRYDEPLLQPKPGALHDWQIFHELQMRLDSRRSPRFLRRLFRLSPRRQIDLGLRWGPYGSGWSLFGKGLSLSRLKQQTHGLDLGPLEPCMPQALRKRPIQLAHPQILDDLKRLQGTLQNKEDGLLLIGRRQMRSNNSWMHHCSSLACQRNPCTLQIHPEDAASLGIVGGERVNVESRVGKIQVEVEVSDQMMKGVVSLPHGWGHHRKGTHWGLAQQQAGASLNDLTDELRIDPLSGNAALNGTPVRLSALPEKS